MQRFLKVIVVLFLVIYQTSVLAYSIEMCGFRHSVNKNATRLVFDFNHLPVYSVHNNASETVIVLNFAHTKLSTNLQKKWLAKTKNLGIKLVLNQENLSLSIQLKHSVTPKYFTLKNPARLVLDLCSNTNANANPVNNDEQSIENSELRAAKALASELDKKPPEEQSVSQPVVIDNSAASNKKSRNVIVVIDPGHGGKDPGAIGDSGTREKDVVLAVSKDLAEMLNRTPGITAVLTRNSDYFIPLRERLNIAHSYKADIFIAIHADAYKFKHSTGASVFALSQRGATSEAARWLAEKENESELGQAISDKSMLLKSVLLDLAQTATIGSSLEVGGEILNQLISITHLHHSRVEQAAFVVLKSPDIPSLLVETGFLSDPSEEIKLRNSEYQNQLAYALSQGIKNYFQEHPPIGTYFAVIKNKNMRRI